MMRPMKLAGSELLFGRGTLAHLETLKARKIVIVLGDDIVYKNGVMDIVTQHLNHANIPFDVFMGVEPDPGLKTVLKGAKFMLEKEPDFILAIGGGSTMDAAKAMWIFYEHPHLTRLDQLTNKETFPKLRTKAHFGCVPTTAGTASEVSRSIVITDDVTGYKYGIGNMEMMPDLAICDPVTTLSMPKSITAQSGFDALSHVLESVVSNRANYLTDVLAYASIKDIFEVLPKVYNDLNNLELREEMLTLAMVAGLSFTNASLGLVHAISHSLGGLFKIPHGSCNSILLPHVIRFNQANPEAKAKYEKIEQTLGRDLITALNELSDTIGMPKGLKDLVSLERLNEKMEELIDLSLKDGSLKTNPIQPTRNQVRAVVLSAYEGR